MCARSYCPSCGQELIHRDHRQHYESASALGQILSREGPREMAIGDIDLYSHKRSRRILRLLEHKQPEQPMGSEQQIVLRKLNLAIQSLVESGRLAIGSGVFVITGKLEMSSQSNHGKVDFAGPQTVKSIDGSVQIETKSRAQLYDWLNCGSGWHPHHNRGRWEWRQ